MRKDFDFTRAFILGADGCPDVDNAPSPRGPAIAQAFFGDLSEHLVDCISASSFVVGCFAWITHERVLDALARLAFGCQIICQKEDFLRPDSGARAGWKSTLQSHYRSLHCHVDRHVCADVAGIGRLSVCMDEGHMSAVRCVGNHNRDRNPAWPRMHHKFLVLCSFGSRGRPVPLSVWTGSFNPTANGSKSRENAVRIDSKEIAVAYFREWFQMFAISEPLDWTSEWSAPEYRIGT